MNSIYRTAANSNTDVSSRHWMARVIKTILLFCFVYEFVWLKAPNILSSRKVAFFVAIIWTFYKIGVNVKAKLNRQLFYLWGTMLFLLITTFTKLVVWGGSGDSILLRLLYFIPYVLIVPFLFTTIFDDLTEFIYSLIRASFIQAIIVIIVYISRPAKMFMYNNFLQPGNISYLTGRRAVGLGAEGSSLSLALLCGMIGCIYLWITKGKLQLRIAISYFVMLVACLLSGRIGLYCGIVLFIFNLFIIESKHIIMNFIITLAFGAIGVVVAGYLLTIYVDEDILRLTLNWATEFLREGTSANTAVALANMEVPPLSMYTFLGTGIYRGSSGVGLQLQNDSGYIQNYFALGLIGALIFYVSIYKYFLKLIKKIERNNIRLLMLAFLVLIMLTEAKEPFLFRYVTPMIFLSICYLDNKETKRKSLQTDLMRTVKR